MPRNGLLWLINNEKERRPSTRKKLKIIHDDVSNVIGEPSPKVAIKDVDGSGTGARQKKMFGIWRK